MKNPSEETVIQAMKKAFNTCPLDDLYTSLHNVLLNEYGICVAEQNGGRILANELFNVRALLEALGEMKGIVYREAG